MLEEHGLYQRGMRTIDEDEQEDYYVVYAVTGDATRSFLSEEEDETAVSFRPQTYTGQISLLVIMFVMIGYLATRGGEFAMAQQRGAQAVDVQSKAPTWDSNNNNNHIQITISGKEQSNAEVRATAAIRRPPSSAPGAGKLEEDDIAPTAPIKIPKLPRDYHRPDVDEEEQGEQDIFPGPEMDLKLPSVWNAYRSVADTNNITETDLPVFFHLPKSGGSTIKDILLNCHIQAMASEVGVGDSHGQDSELQLVHVKGQSDLAMHVNVDVTTRNGLVRARSMGLIHSGLAQVIATPLLFESAAILFHDPVQGRVFAVFRHPIRRAVSMFAYLRKAYWEPTYRPEFGDWNIEHYALSDVVEDNFMVRQLAQVPDDMSVTERHLELAKAIISQKVLVGLLDRVEDSLVRFEQYFGWRYTKNPTRQETCRNTLLVTGVNTNTDPHNQMPEVASKAFQMLQRKNALDLLLYAHVERLFDYQAVLVENVPRDIRLINTTCALCDNGAQQDDPTTI